MKKILLLLISFLILMLVLSCGQASMLRTGAVSLTVSAESTNSRSSRAVSRGDFLHEDVDSAIYESIKGALIEPLEEENRGNLIYELTPSSFVFPIRSVFLFKDASKPNAEGNRIEVSGARPFVYDPLHDGYFGSAFDMFYSDGIFRNKIIERAEYQILDMTVVEGSGFGKKSSIGVVLPEVYDGQTLRFNDGYFETETYTENGVTYFSFRQLCPFKQQVFKLTFSSTFTESHILYPGNPGDAFIEYQTIVGSTITGGSSVEIPLKTPLNFNSYKNPELYFDWELESLIQIWDSNTPTDYSDDVICFRLDNPIPVEVGVRENKDNSYLANESDHTAPADVSQLEFIADYRNLIAWVNPTDRDFKETVITRKEGSAPADRKDGDNIYRGYFPVFGDYYGTQGVDYYYLIQTVDYSGNYSEGKVVHQIQP